LKFIKDKLENESPDPFIKIDETFSRKLDIFFDSKTVGSMESIAKMGEFPHL